MKASIENGFSLIEILVSLFVLAVGVIGAAGMQLAALRTSQQSVFQTRALHLATEMAERMRANVGQMKLADDANPYLQIDHQSSSSHITTSFHDCYGSDAQCDTAQLAQFEIAEWLQRIGNELPGGRARVCRDASPWDAEGRRFNWDCSANATSSENGNAGSLVIKIGWQEKNPDGKPVRKTDEQDAPAIALLVAPYAK
jgi:type IV pilus assembly protein PilV